MQMLSETADGTDIRGARERVIAEGIADVVRELMLCDPSHLLAFVALDMHAAMADLVETASELYFKPGFVSLGDGSSLEVCWSRPPSIVLDMKLSCPELSAYFHLMMSGRGTKVALNYIRFDRRSDDPHANTSSLNWAIMQNRKHLHVRPL